MRQAGSPVGVALEYSVNEPPVGLDDRVDIRHDGIAPGDVEADLLSDETVVLAQPTMPGELDDGAVETEILVSDGDAVARTAGLNKSVQGRHDHLLALLREGADREPCAQRFEARPQRIELPCISAAEARHLPVGIGLLDDQSLVRELVKGRPDRRAGKT